MKYQFRALRQDGRELVGQIESSSIRSAHRDLIRRGIRPMTIAPDVARRTSVARTKRKARRRDYIYVVKELHSLIAGGVPIAEAVSALVSATENPVLVSAYTDLNTRLRRGEKFSVAFRGCFPNYPIYIHRIIEAGELAGRLAEGLADAAAELEHEARIETEMRNALVYPVFLIGFGVLAILFIFLVVVPRFAAMFRGKYDAIPFLSYVVIAGGMWFHDHLLLSFALVAAVAITVVYVFREPEMRMRAREAVARIPFVNNWLIEIETARWAAVLARLMENRVPLLQSLELARTVMRSRDIQQRLVQVERAVRAGNAFAKGLDEYRFLPATALTLVRVGERSGNLADMMRSVASIYEEIVRNRTKAFLALVEPIAIVLIGGVIALVAVAIFLAITSINKVPGL
ncbi:MAG TPA: type II secretion system F family protein [Stellaceae bacterium]|nr:type II secretion system F family protein [Stellaceae bacterium]